MFKFSKNTNWKKLAELDEGFPGSIGIADGGIMSDEIKPGQILENYLDIVEENGMNTVFSDSLPEKRDKLDQIFDAQEKFRRIMGKGQDNIIDLMDEKQKGQLVYDHLQAIASEIQELMNCIYWKSWTKEAKEGKRFMFRNIENAKEEIADIYCFLGDICAAVGMNAEELTAINVRKTQVNIDRQLNKYAMDTKDGKDSSDLWQQIKDGELKGKVVTETTRNGLGEVTSKVETNLDTGEQKQVIGKKYLEEGPDKVTIYRVSDTAFSGNRYSVTLSSTNETKIISIDFDEVMTNDTRSILMKKISKEFNLTKPFQIEEL